MKITTVLIALLALSFTNPALAQTPTDTLVKQRSVAQFLQDISVTILAETDNSKGSGSGVIVTRKVDNEDVSFVWTAAHVVDALRKTREVIDKGATKTVVEFEDAYILREIVQGGRYVGEVKMSARVMKYSDADSGHDLALLRIRKTGFNQASAEFYLGEEIPPIGTKLYHVGSLLGVGGANSMTSGIISQQGRILGGSLKYEFDQSTASALPGSSGGGIYLEDGKYIGMLVRGADATFNFFVPIRRMIAWSKENNMLWMIDPKEKMPTAKELDAMPIEDVGALFKHDAAKSTAAPGKSIDLLYRDPQN